VFLAVDIRVSKVLEDGRIFQSGRTVLPYNYHQTNFSQLPTFQISTMATATDQSTTLTSREKDLAGKVAVVTGASRGIGRATVLNLARRGCSVLGTCSSEKSLHLFDSIREDVATSYKDEPNLQTVKIHGVVADIFSLDCSTAIVNALAEHFSSRVDIFVNNAADSRDGRLGQLSLDEIQQSLVANIQTPVLIVEELVKTKMFQPNSRIIYISSIRSRQPWSEQLMYSAGKSAGESLCRTWADAFGGKDERFSFMSGTTANSVSVGLTQTESVLNCPEPFLSRFKQEFIPLQSIPRFGLPEDVADVVGLLCSHEARWMTGCVVSASGGGIRMQ
jgi:3-oxoacyl-[acyl-carrier protein] reductase